MFCYKDRSWCTAKDCANLKCDRNTRNKDVFNPDEFWSKYICYAVDIKNNCKDYVKDDIEFTLNIIEQYIAKGNKLPYLLLTFYSSSKSHSMELVKRLKNLGFKVYNKILTTDGEFKCCIDWSE